MNKIWGNKTEEGYTATAFIPTTVLRRNSMNHLRIIFFKFKNSKGVYINKRLPSSKLVELTK